MKIFVAVINIAFLLFISYRLWKADTDIGTRRFFWPALFAKVLAGIALGLVYTYYYTTGDTFLYFDDGKKLADLARSDFFLYLRFLWLGDDSFVIWSDLNALQSRALYMVKLTSFVNLITLDNYWIISGYFSFFSFVCTWLLVKTITRSFPAAKYPALFGFLFLPSVVFWTSGLIKESAALGALFFLTSIVLDVWTGQLSPRWKWIVAPLALWLLWNLKYYYLAVFAPVAFAALAFRFLSAYVKLTSVVYKVLLWGLAFVLPLMVISSIHPNFYPHRIMEVIVSSNDQFLSLSAPEDLIGYNSLDASVGGIIRNSPWALFSGLFRPLPWEAHTAFQWVIAIENLILIVLFCASMRNISNGMRSPQRLLIWSTVVYVSMLCVFLALSTPNFGTLSRYRVSFLPFFFLLITIENPLLKGLSGLKERS